jgi:RNA polymerase sigma factor (TIGR02999 family)
MLLTDRNPRFEPAVARTWRSAAVKPLLFVMKSRRVAVWKGASMAPDRSGEVTQILGQIEAGNEAAQAQLFTLVYDELRSLAGSLMRRERPEHTLQPTALVNEAAARLLGEEALRKIPNRAYFFGMVGLAMRRVLVDHARTRGAKRRGGDQDRLPLDAAIDLVEQTHQIDLLALDELLQELEKLNKRQYEVVMLRFFGGFEVPEIAEQLGIGLSTAEKDWRVARAWLRQRLGEKG